MRKSIMTFLCVLILSLSMITIPVLADSTKVLTLGQDLSDEQEAFMINYFGADPNTTQMFYVNNQQEYEYVGNWFSKDQIGNITISCAYVQPTTSGGINVQTANLTDVSGDYLADILVTAGVSNCNVIAAAPFPVSGTGALTGVMIAYQMATGEELDVTKRDLAVQEFTVIQQTADVIGEEEANQLINAVKLEVISSDMNADDTERIEETVNQFINSIEQDSANIGTGTTRSGLEGGSGLSDSDRQAIFDWAAQIAGQDYQYEDVKNTLERVENNLSSKTDISFSGEESGIGAENADIFSDMEFSLGGNNRSAELQEDSIFFDVNNDLIDSAYRSSTININNLENAEDTNQNPNTNLYDMPPLESYHLDTNEN